ncbi:hypothetical protein [Pararhizobium sp.]|uniref:hypothetical protein n=1 Tax=Pararhizobium sp. TaxID=1977563 RepID=UPI003BA86CA7
MDIKTFRDLWWNDDLEEVHEELDDSWRHGNYVYAVFLHAETGKYWSVNYQVSGDGEYNTLREAECDDPAEVFPHKKIVETIVYRATPAAS